MSEIALRGVTKRFPDGTLAVKQTHFTIRDGEFFVLVGPSGCGKSTLLNMIAGIEDVTDGEILVDGKRINDLDPKDRNMAMVFQSYAIYPHMTVRGNLAFPLKLAGAPRDEIDRRVAHAASILELEELLERRPATLSGGQRQRVAMGRAIVRKPVAFLLDEPLSNLDARLRVQMRSEIARLQGNLGTTTVYVTHDQTEAMTLGHRVAVLRKGEVQQIGTPRELYGAPRNVFVAGFVGSPAMNFLPGEIRNGRLVLPIAELPLPGPVSERPIIAGIRPEHFEAVSAIQDHAFFEVKVERVEWLGAELYVYFQVQCEAGRLASLPQDVERTAIRADRIAVVARLDPASRAAAGERIRLRLEPDRIQLFDAESGENLAAAAQHDQV